MNYFVGGGAEVTEDNEEIVKRSKGEGTYSVSMPLAIFKLTGHCLSSDQDKKDIAA